MKRIATLSLVGFLATALVSACSNDETAPADDDHTPVRVGLIVGSDTMTTDTLFLPFGQTVTVRGIFFNSADDNLDDVEAEHWSKLTFTPTTLATAAVDTAHHFQHTVEVQGAVGATGTVAVGFGHDELADEHTLNAPVKIVAAAAR